MAKMTDEAKAENEQGAAKRKYEEKAVRDSDVKGEVEPSQKLQSDKPDPSDTSIAENDPKKNPQAPTSPFRTQ